MIRFLPDTFRDAIWRPLAIASPEGGVYVEIIAPDFRFAFAVVLVLAWLLLARGNQTRRSPPIILLAFTVLAFVPWLMSTGNGRYFMAFLLIAGPLCIGLVQQLPVSPGLRIFLAAGMVFWQGYLVYDVNPWRNWGLVQWEESPAFGIEVPPEVAAQPATYVTVSSVSFSLIALRFHPASRWINISSLQGLADQSVDRLRAQSVIAAAGPLRLIFPTLPGAQDRDRMDPELGKGIDDLLARHSLSIEDEAQCRLMRSSGLAGTASRRTREGAADTVDAQGFWLCPLARHASPRVIPAVPVPQRTEDVFDRLERLCPRIFRPGEVASSRVPGGAVRGYPGSDFKLYVLDQGEVWYKYLRALNPVLLGRVDAILEPAFTMDCNRIPGRSGLPWERGI